MKKYIVYNAEGKIQRTGVCSKKDLLKQAEDGEFVMEGSANDVTQKIVGSGQFRRIIDKTPEEIEAEKPPEISFEKRTAHITNEQWQDVLNRLRVLEGG